jgi:hypothetical protein
MASLEPILAARSSAYAAKHRSRLRLGDIFKMARLTRLEL